MRQKTTIDEKREFVAYYEKYGPKATEEKYGLTRYMAHILQGRFIIAIRELSYRSITKFVETSSHEEILEFISSFNKFGRAVTCNKYHIKRDFVSNVRSVRLLIELGLNIHQSTRSRVTLYMKIDNMRKDGIDFKEIIEELSSSYSANAINIRVKQWCDNNGFVGDDNFIKDNDFHPIDVKALREYAKTRTSCEIAKHFNCNRYRIYRLLRLYNIEYNASPTPIRDKVTVDPENVKRYIQTHTIPQSAKHFGVSYQSIYQLCKRHHWEYTKIYKDTCKTKECYSNGSRSNKRREA